MGRPVRSCNTDCQPCPVDPTPAITDCDGSMFCIAIVDGNGSMTQRNAKIEKFIEAFPERFLFVLEVEGTKPITYPQAFIDHDRAFSLNTELSVKLQRDNRQSSIANSNDPWGKILSIVSSLPVDDSNDFYRNNSGQYALFVAYSDSLGVNDIKATVDKLIDDIDSYSRPLAPYIGRNYIRRYGQSEQAFSNNQQDFISAFLIDDCCGLDYDSAESIARQDLMDLCSDVTGFSGSVCDPNRLRFRSGLSYQSHTRTRFFASRDYCKDDDGDDILYSYPYEVDCDECFKSPNTNIWRTSDAYWDAKKQVNLKVDAERGPSGNPENVTNLNYTLKVQFTDEDVSNAAFQNSVTWYDLDVDTFDGTFNTGQFYQRSLLLNDNLVEGGTPIEMSNHSWLQQNGDGPIAYNEFIDVGSDRCKYRRYKRQFRIIATLTEEGYPAIVGQSRIFMLQDILNIEQPSQPPEDPPADDPPADDPPADDPPADDPPVTPGDVINLNDLDSLELFGKRWGRRTYYDSFEVDSLHYQLHNSSARYSPFNNSPIDARPFCDRYDTAPVIWPTISTYQRYRLPINDSISTGLEDPFDIPFPYSALNVTAIGDIGELTDTEAEMLDPNRDATVGNHVRICGLNERNLRKTPSSTIKNPDPQPRRYGVRMVSGRYKFCDGAEFGRQVKVFGKGKFVLVTCPNFVVNEALGIYGCVYLYEISEENYGFETINLITRIDNNVALTDPSDRNEFRGFANVITASEKMPGNVYKIFIGSHNLENDQDFSPWYREGQKPQLAEYTFKPQYASYNNLTRRHGRVVGYTLDWEGTIDIANGYGLRSAMTDIDITPDGTALIVGFGNEKSRQVSSVNQGFVVGRQEGYDDFAGAILIGMYNSSNGRYRYSDHYYQDSDTRNEKFTFGNSVSVRCAWDRDVLTGVRKKYYRFVVTSDENPRVVTAYNPSSALIYFEVDSSYANVVVGNVFNKISPSKPVWYNYFNNSTRSFGPPISPLADEWIISGRLYWGRSSVLGVRERTVRSSVTQDYYGETICLTATSDHPKNFSDFDDDSEDCLFSFRNEIYQFLKTGIEYRASDGYDTRYGPKSSNDGSRAIHTTRPLVFVNRFSSNYNKSLVNLDLSSRRSHGFSGLGTGTIINDSIVGVDGIDKKYFPTKFKYQVTSPRLNKITNTSDFRLKVYVDGYGYFILDPLNSASIAKNAYLILFLQKSAVDNSVPRYYITSHNTLFSGNDISQSSTLGFWDLGVLRNDTTVVRFGALST